MLILEDPDLDPETVMLESDPKDPDLGHETEDPHQGLGEDLGMTLTVEFAALNVKYQNIISLWKDRSTLEKHTIVQQLVKNKIFSILGAPEVDQGADLGNREVVLAINEDIVQGPGHTAKEVKAKKGGKMAHGPHQKKR